MAVPKLFGMVAKAKASEVPVAAGSYTKLQDAFLAEKTALGNWKNIGYVAPGNGNSSNFCYSQGSWWSLVITPNGSNAVNYAHNLSYAP